MGGVRVEWMGKRSVDREGGGVRPGRGLGRRC